MSFKDSEELLRRFIRHTDESGTRLSPIRGLNDEPFGHVHDIFIPKGEEVTIGLADGHGKIVNVMVEG